jgi:hypothetical protein
MSVCATEDGLYSAYISTIHYLAIAISHDSTHCLRLDCCYIILGCDACRVVFDNCAAEARQFSLL